VTLPRCSQRNTPLLAGAVRAALGNDDWCDVAERAGGLAG
jgi:hypothetical protein